jgi:curli biogenesis system outer membrane secretion channel CsgG
MGTSQDVGGGLADVLIRELVEGGTYSIIERGALDAVLKEQNFSNSSRADPKTAAAIGRVLGVDAIVIGSITQFGVEESAVAVPTGPLGRIPGLGGGGKRVNAKATVAITVRMVDVGTGQVLTAVTGTGQSSQSSIAAGGYSSGGVDMSSSSFQQSMLGEAVNGAVEKAAAGLTQFAPNLARARASYSGLVADVSGATLILNVGRSGGARVGDTVEITRPGRTITDPQTKKILRTITDTVGTARITEVDDVSATATVVGSAAPRVGDQIRHVP